MYIANIILYKLWFVPGVVSKDLLNKVQPSIPPIPLIKGKGSLGIQSTSPPLVLVLRYCGGWRRGKGRGILKDFVLGTARHYAGGPIFAM